MTERDEIKFVASHYEEGRFDKEQALKRIMPIRKPWWTRAKIVAAMAGIVALSATAAVLIDHWQAGQEIETVQEPDTEVRYIMQAVRTIDFEDAPLPVVVAEIKNVYGVEVDNIPDNAAGYSLSLHYEGTAADLVETINDILGTDMTISEQ